MTRFKSKKVVVMGLGLHGGGAGVAKFFCSQEAEVLVTDLKTKKELKESINKLKGLPIKYVLGKHRKEDFIGADLIIKNPDVPSDSLFLKIAKENNVPVETDISLFFDLSKAFIIGITGTKGKSTTATLIYQFLKTKHPRTFLAGNIGTSPLELLDRLKNSSDWVILELSSFELEDLKKSPQIAVFTNILKDHLNRYKSMADYIKAKESIFKHQAKKDILVLNYDDPIVREFSACSKTYFFSKEKIKKKYDVKAFKLYGEHNLSNISAAVLVAELLKVPKENIERIVKSFKGVPFRQEFIKEINSVKYINDTAATMPEAAIEALKAISARFPDSSIILIAGGQDKNLDYKGMGREIKKKVSELVLLPGTGSDKLKKELKGVKISPVGSMKEAVKKTSVLAEKGDIVLLSPGAASFNLFKNEFDRGEQFNKALK